MGREANCKCDWAGTTGNVKALLETSELILRGEIRKRIPFAELKGVKAQAARLCFTVAGEPVQLISEQLTRRNGRRRSTPAPHRYPENWESPARPSFRPSALLPTKRFNPRSLKRRKSRPVNPTSSLPVSKLRRTWREQSNR
ncbi:MAG: hypothetical protein WBE76_12945 [Terracidiphilus sp.]